MDLARELKAARLAAGWGLPRAAKAVQLDPPMSPRYWWLIEQGRRSPSVLVMEAMLRVQVLSFPPDLTARFRAAAIPGVGRDRRMLRASRRAENRAAWAASHPLPPLSPIPKVELVPAPKAPPSDQVHDVNLVSPAVLVASPAASPAPCLSPQMLYECWCRDRWSGPAGATTCHAGHPLPPGSGRPYVQ